MSIPERFRRAKFVRYDDITIRFSSLATGRKLEIMGLNAQYMLYAIANQEETGFLRWDLLYAAKLMEVAEILHTEPISNTNGSSRFLAIPRKVLFSNGAVAATSELSFAYSEQAQSSGN